MIDYFMKASSLLNCKMGFIHTFTEATYVKPTFCEHCAGFVSKHFVYRGHVTPSCVDVLTLAHGTRDCAPGQRSGASAVAVSPSVFALHHLWWWDHLSVAPPCQFWPITLSYGCTAEAAQWEMQQRGNWARWWPSSAVAVRVFFESLLQPGIWPLTSPWVPKRRAFAI